MTLQVNSTAVNEVYLNRNVGYTVVGSPNIVNGVASGFSVDDCLKTPAFSPTSNTWEFVCKFTTPSSLEQSGIVTGLGITNSFAPLFITNAQGALSMYLSSNGTSWDIAQTNVAMLSAETTYTIKEEFTGSAYNFYILENGEWTLKKTIESNKHIYGGTAFVFGNNRGTGATFTGGSIDLNSTYIKINGVTWFNGKQQANPTINTLQINGNTVWQR